MVTLENIDKFNEEFVFRLKRQYPNLTNGELELCLTLRAKLSSKEIASARNITPASVKQARSRLRKKLGVDKNTDLYSFLGEF